LKGWLKENPAAAKDLRLVYFGCYDPAWVGIDYRLPPALTSTSRKSPASIQASIGPLPGWYVVSKNSLIGHSMPVPDGSGGLHFRFFGEPFCSYLNDFKPVDSIGDSMLVYHLNMDEVNVARAKHGLATLEAVTESLPQPEPATLVKVSSSPE